LYCEDCGVPHGITRGNIWYADGTITGRHPPYIKGTFFDVDELNCLFRSLSEYLDYDISDIVASGKYHDAKEYMGAMIGKMHEASGGKIPPDEELYRMMLYPISIWGVAIVEFKSIRPEGMVIHVKYPYSVPLLCGDVAGVADAVTGREHRAVWEGDGEEGIMTVTPDHGYAATSGRIDEGIGYGVEPGAEELACERCEACGAPRGVSELFAWDRERCRIEERSSGRRYCFNNTRGITAVLGMLVGELGEDIEEKMVDIAREYSRTLYGERAGGPRLEDELEGFPFRGWGKVVGVPAGDRGSSFNVENPYNEVLVAGRVWGMLEAAAEGSLRITSRAGSGDTLRLAFEPS
jgi:ribosomal protein S14